MDRFSSGNLLLLAACFLMSGSWVNKWRLWLCQADPDDVMALHSRSRARHTPPFSIASQPAVVQRILEIRTDPPENAARAFQGQKPSSTLSIVTAHSNALACACRARRPRVFKILRQAGCIAKDCRRKPKPLELRQKGGGSSVRQAADESLVPADPDGKRKPGG